MTRHLIPYAGFDPNENDFSDIILPPRWGPPTEAQSRNQKNFGAMACKDKINATIAIALRESGIGYRKIGIILARNAGRRMPYNYDSIVAAIRRAKKENS